MQIAILRRAAGSAYRFCRSNCGLALGCGILAAPLLLSLHHLFVATFGSSLAMSTASAVALALGVEASRLAARRLRLVPSPRTATLVLFALAAWTVAAPWTSSAVASLLSGVSVESLAVRGVELAVAIAAALALVAPAALAAGLLPAALPGSSAERGIVLRSFLVGLALSLLLCGLVVAPAVGVQSCGLAAAIVAAILFVAAVPAAGSSAQPGQDLGARANARSLSVLDRASTPAAVFGLGMAVAVGARMVHQLIAATAPVLVLEWVAVLGGVATGCALAGRRSRSDEQPRSLLPAACLIAAGALAVWTAGFPLLLRLMLLVNANISTVWLLTLTRGAVACALLVPLGLAWGLLGVRRGGGDAAVGETRFHALAFVAGWAAVRWFGIGVFLVPALVAATVILLLTIVAAGFFRHRPITLRRAGMPAAFAACTLVALPLALTGYDAPRAAQLLFSTRVFMMHRAGQETDSLPVLDDARLAARVEAEHGTLTLWKHHGLQVQIRESGIPRGLASLNSRVFPEYSAEVMQATLPLVLHEHPDRVLVLGLGGGTPVSTCLGFPVQKLTCVEGDRALVDAVRHVVWSQTPITPFEDARLRLLAADPVLAMSGRVDEQDVIIANPDHPSLWKSSPSFTLEFYKNVAARLAPDGIFCQRFQQIDFGPEPLRELAQTMRSVFKDTLAAEVAPGEYLFLGAKTPGGLQREGLVDRLSAPHVRRTLARVGWDWSVVLNLTVYDHAALGQFVGETKAVAVTAANGAFAFELPGEVMRWGNKSAELQAKLAPKGSSMLRWPILDGNDPDLLHRLSEVVGARELMTKFPDQPWAYRKTLKEQLTKRPRSAIEQVSGTLDRVLHPEDRRRKVYLETLGRATGKASPPLESVRAINDFVEPYDPLVTFFAHHEMAALHDRADQKDLKAELRHRLHTIYFADHRDRSVRNVAAALDLVATHPEIARSPRERFDLLNGLVQSMKARWDVRGSGRPSSARVALNDVDISMTSINRALGVMDDLAPQAEVSPTSWKARRTYIDRALVRPLRTYRSNMLPHHVKQKRVGEAKSASAR